VQGTPGALAAVRTQQEVGNDSHRMGTAQFRQRGCPLVPCSVFHWTPISASQPSRPSQQNDAQEVKASAVIEWSFGLSWRHMSLLCCPAAQPLGSVGLAFPAAAWTHCAAVLRGRGKECVAYTGRTALDSLTSKAREFAASLATGAPRAPASGSLDRQGSEAAQQPTASEAAQPQPRAVMPADEAPSIAGASRVSAAGARPGSTSLPDAGPSGVGRLAVQSLGDPAWGAAGSTAMALLRAVHAVKGAVCERRCAAMITVPAGALFAICFPPQAG
jgi:hypothetical protein